MKWAASLANRRELFDCNQGAPAGQRILGRLLLAQLAAEDARSGAGSWWFRSLFARAESVEIPRLWERKTVGWGAANVLP